MLITDESEGDRNGVVGKKEKKSHRHPLFIRVCWVFLFSCEFVSCREDAIGRLFCFGLVGSYDDDKQKGG